MAENAADAGADERIIQVVIMTRQMYSSHFPGRNTSCASRGGSHGGLRAANALGHHLSSLLRFFQSSSCSLSSHDCRSCSFFSRRSCLVVCRVHVPAPLPRALHPASTRSEVGTAPRYDTTHSFSTSSSNISRDTCSDFPRIFTYFVQQGIRLFRPRHPLQFTR